MLKSEKSSVVSELTEIYNKFPVVLVMHYHGLTVAEITKLRRSLHALGGGVQVIKNTLSKIAINNVQLIGFNEFFSGPTAIAYAKDPVAASKIVTDFAKSNPKLKVLGGVFEKDLVNLEIISQVSKLPSLEQLHSNIIGILQTPATSLARLLKSSGGSVACVISSYAKKS